MHDECAFDQQQQEEAALFWAVSDSVNAIENHGIDSFLVALTEMLSASQKQFIKNYFENAV